MIWRETKLSSSFKREEEKKTEFRKDTLVNEILVINFFINLSLLDHSRNFKSNSDNMPDCLVFNFVNFEIMVSVRPPKRENENALPLYLLNLRLNQTPIIGWSIG